MQGKALQSTALQDRARVSRAERSVGSLKLRRRSRLTVDVSVVVLLSTVQHHCHTRSQCI
jgi:hypothetical protein